MTKKRTLADLAAAFTAKTSNESNDQQWKLFFNFWKAPVDTTSTVRFLPDADEENPMAFLVENLAHELVVNGKRQKVPCLKMYGEDCPACALSSKFYDEKDPDHNKVLGKKFYRKKSYIGQVMVVETPVEHDQEQLVKLIEFGPKIFKQMQSAFQDGDMEEAPYEFKGGYNFRIKKTKSGEYADYGTSSFAPKQTDVAPAIADQLNLYKLSDFRTARITRTEMEVILKQQNVDIPDEPPAKADEPAREEEPAKPEPKKPSSVVQQLKARAAAMAEKQKEEENDD